MLQNCIECGQEMAMEDCEDTDICSLCKEAKMEGESDTVSPEDIATLHMQSSGLDKTVAAMRQSLTPRERKILDMRFGFGESGEKFKELPKVTRERIRAIEEKALKKLRARKLDDK